MSTISRDDWLRAVADAGFAQDHDPDAITIGEFAAMFQIPPSTAAHRLKKLVHAGRAAETTKRQTTYRAWRLVP